MTSTSPPKSLRKASRFLAELPWILRTWLQALHAVNLAFWSLLIIAWKSPTSLATPLPRQSWYQSPRWPSP